MVNIHIYDGHAVAVGKRNYVVEVGDLGAQFTFRSHHEGARPADYVFLCDELTTTKFIHFFPRNRRVALLKESPLITGGLSKENLRRNFKLVLTHSENFLREGPPFCRNLFSSSWITTPSPETPKTKLLSFVGNVERTVGEGYRFRAEIAQLLADKADLYGKGLKPISNKEIGMQDYCFSVAMENHRENFYFSEKLIDCFLMGCIPIYWGCPAIEEIFDKRGLLIFENTDQLCKIVAKLSFDLFEQMRPYALKNLAIARKMQLDSFEGFLARSFSITREQLGEFAKPITPLSVSKLMAGSRLLLDNIAKQL